jgi:hypothetical protein
VTAFALLPRAQEPAACAAFSRPRRWTTAFAATPGVAATRTTATPGTGNAVGRQCDGSGVCRVRLRGVSCGPARAAATSLARTGL